LCPIAVDIVFLVVVRPGVYQRPWGLRFGVAASCARFLRPSSLPEPFMHVCTPRLENVIKSPSPSRLRISHFTFWTTPSIFNKSTGHQLMLFRQFSQWGSCARPLPDLCHSEVTRFKERHAPHFRDAACCVRRAVHAADRTCGSLVGCDDVAPPTATGSLALPQPHPTRARSLYREHLLSQPCC
jgi:hypothetical protein